MRGGLVAAGAIFVLIGFSLVVIVQIDGGRFIAQFVGENWSRAFWVVCMLPSALVIIGFMIFLAGLVGKSKAELEAMSRASAPQVVYVQSSQPRGQRPPPPPPR